MGSSLPPPATLDLVGSVARRVGANVELVFSRADVPAGHGDLVVRLTQSAQVVTGTAEVRPASDGQGLDVVVQVPGRELGDGIWNLKIGRTASEDLTAVTARLLVQGRRPVVLLWGQKSEKSRVPAPKPQPSLTRRLAATGGKALDAGLRPLPDEQATKIRATARKLAKAVLR